MSYDVIKSVKIENGKVMVNVASSNVYPRTFEDWEIKKLSALLKEKGIDAVELEIMKAYEEGNFQSSSGKYVRALKVLEHMPEYKEFNWRIGGVNSEEYTTSSKNREERMPEFEELMRKALKQKLPSDKFVITKPHFSGDVYLWKVTKRFIKWDKRKAKAKIYRYYADAKQLINNCSISQDWLIVKIK